MQNYKNLSDVLAKDDNIQQGQSQGGSQDLSNVSYFNSYLTAFNIQLVHRFPDVTDLTTIDYQTIRSIAQFCASTTIVAQEVWDDLFAPQMNVGKRGFARTTRAA
jgi:hypothetical protein